MTPADEHQMESLLERNIRGIRSSMPRGGAVLAHRMHAVPVSELWGLIGTKEPRVAQSDSARRVIAARLQKNGRSASGKRHYEVNQLRCHTQRREHKSVSHGTCMSVTPREMSNAQKRIVTSCTQRTRWAGSCWHTTMAVGRAAKAPRALHTNSVGKDQVVGRCASETARAMPNPRQDIVLLMRQDGVARPRLHGLSHQLLALDAIEAPARRRLPHRVAPPHHGCPRQ